MREKDEILGNFIDVSMRKGKKSSVDMEDVFRTALLEVLLDIRDSILLAAGLVEVTPEGTEDAGESTDEEQGA